jgi:EAL domain-containing protein (putative c-di-GMP-specific phosphodiesterase class I)/GGDEF domain-containing protein
MFGESVPLLLESNGPEIFLGHVREKIDMALQPITDIRSGVAHGFEALARNTSALGFASISEFFSFAEHLDVRTEVDSFLYSKAAAKLAAVEYGSDALLFINVDRQRARSLADDIAGLIKGLAKAGLAPSDVCVEITEGGDTSGFEGLMPAVEQLRRRGFRIAIDDFGTGYSGLQSLYNLQPEYVKIDRFFISGLERDGRKRLFVSRVVELAHILGSKVVAEGVERVEELHACRDAGCDLVQGYFVARPSCDVDDVRPVYAAVVGNPDRRLAPRGVMTLENEDVVIRLGTIPDGSRVESVVEFFLSNPQCSFLPVVDARSMPIGIIRERDLRSLVQSPFGRDLLKNNSFPMRIRDFVSRLPVVDEKTCPSRLIEQCAQSVEEGIIVTKDLRYAGFLPANALLRLAGLIRIRQAQSQNPLTHLPANDAIREFIGRACGDRSVAHAFCHLDFNHFKPFNDVYGFHIGDRAIIMFAELLRSEFADDGVFLGHIGGDDFFVGVSGPMSDLADRLAAVTGRFARNAESLYGAEHRTSGYIECAGRDGVLSRFRLLTCSVGLLHLPPGEDWVTPDEVSRELSQLKMVAKKSPSSFSAATFGREGGGAGETYRELERVTV